MVDIQRHDGRVLRAVPRPPHSDLLRSPVPFCVVLFFNPYGEG